MAETKTKATKVSVTEFLAKVEDPRKRAESNLLVDMMTRVTGEKPKMWGPSIVGFGSYHYKYATGHEGDAPLAGFSPRAAEFSIYLSVNDEPARNALLGRLGNHRMGKSCLYVKRLDQIDLGVLEELVHSSVAEVRATYPST
jgi:hypothetical protein